MGRFKFMTFDEFKFKLKKALYVFYNPKTNLVMGRTWLQFTQLCVFFIAYYLFLAGIFVVQYVIILQFVHLPGAPDFLGPRMTDILRSSIALSGVPKHLEELPAYDCNNESSYSSYVKQLKEYLEELEKSTLPDCPTIFANKARPDCKFPLSLLGATCSDTNGKFGFDIGKPCILLKMNNIYDFVPKGRDTDDFIKVECHFFDPTNSETSPVATFPSGGLLRNALPYFTGFKGTPLVAVQVPVNLRTGELQCSIISDDVKVSGSFELGQAIGRYSLDFEKSINCPP